MRPVSRRIRSPEERPAPDANRRDEVEPELEARLARDRERQALRVRVRDCRSRRTRARPDRARRSRAAARCGRAPRRAHATIARAKARSPGRLPSSRLPERVDASHCLRVEADAGAEREATLVDAADRDPPGPLLRDRVRHDARRLDRVRRQPEAAREDARAAAREKADRHVLLEAVQRLVEAAVAREDDDRIRAAAARLGHELGRMTGPLGRARRGLRRRVRARLRTAASRSSVTRVANGLTTRKTFIDSRSRACRRAGAP